MRRNNFNTLRLLFAVLVIFSHSYPVVFGTDEREPLYRYTRGAYTLGAMAVAFFFVVSGFLITRSWLNSAATVEYIKKRCLRIFPGYAMVGLVCFAVIPPLAGAHVGFRRDLFVSIVKMGTFNAKGVFS